MVRTREHLMLEYWVGINPGKRSTSVQWIIKWLWILCQNSICRSSNSRREMIKPVKRRPNVRRLRKLARSTLAWWMYLQHFYLYLVTFLFVSCNICILRDLPSGYDGLVDVPAISVIWFLYKIAKAKYQEIQMFSGILLGLNIIISVWWKLSHFSVFPGQHIFLS